MKFFSHINNAWRVKLDALKIMATAMLLLAFATSFGQVERPLGINLSPISDFSTEFAFVDAFRQSRTWISHNADGSGAIESRPSRIPLTTGSSV